MKKKDYLVTMRIDGKRYKRTIKTTSAVGAYKQAMSYAYRCLGLGKGRQLQAMSSVEKSSKK